MRSDLKQPLEFLSCDLFEKDWGRIYGHNRAPAFPSRNLTSSTGINGRSFFVAVFGWIGYVKGSLADDAEAGADALEGCAGAGSARLIVSI